MRETGWHLQKGEVRGTRDHLLSAPVKSPLNSLVSWEVIPIFISHKGTHLFLLLLETLSAVICLKCWCMETRFSMPLAWTACRRAVGGLSGVPRQQKQSGNSLSPLTLNLPPLPSLQQIFVTCPLYAVSCAGHSQCTVSFLQLTNTKQINKKPHPPTFKIAARSCIDDPIRIGFQWQLSHITKYDI